MPGAWPGGRDKSETKASASLDIPISFIKSDILGLLLLLSAYEWDGQVHTVVDGSLIEKASDVIDLTEYRRGGCFFGAELNVSNIPKDKRS